MGCVDLGNLGGGSAVRGVTLTTDAKCEKEVWDSRLDGTALECQLENHPRGQFKETTRVKGLYAACVEFL